MNMQAIMQQAQKMQKQLLDKKEKINKKLFTGKSELVEVVFNGNKELQSVSINKEASLSSDDLEIIEDMMKIAVNDAMKQIDKEVESEMGAAAGPLNGLF